MAQVSGRISAIVLPNSLKGYWIAVLKLMGQANKVIRFTIVSVGLAILALACCSVAESHAWASTRSPQESQDATNDADCIALDVVFLIDQSYSMDGFEQSGSFITGSDPTRQREFAPKSMVSLLATLNRDRCPDVVHRLAVISFGLEAEVDLALSEIKAGDNTNLTDQIEAKRLPWTNPQVAFQAAFNEFNGAEGLGDSTRKRAIILITDGQPCLNPWCREGGEAPSKDVLGYTDILSQQLALDFPFDDMLRQQELCLAKLRMETADEQEVPPEKINDCLRQYPFAPSTDRKNTYIWVLMMKPTKPYPPGLRKAYAAMASSHGGRVIDLGQNRHEIPTNLRSILEQLLGVRATRLDCGNLAVNPYLKSAVFDFYKFDPSIKVRLSYIGSDGTRYEISENQQSPPGGFEVERYSPFGANESYVFALPYAGIWQLESDDCDRFDAFYEPIVFNPLGYQQDLTGLYEQDEFPYYDVDHPVYLYYQMRDQEGETVSQNSRFPIDVQLTVLKPDGRRDSYDMKWYEIEKLFRSIEPLRIPAPGPYRLSIVGRTMEHQGTPVVTSTNEADVFSTSRELFHYESTFEVRPVTPFSITVVSPEPGTELKPSNEKERIHLSFPISITARFTDPLGQSMPDTKLFLSEGNQSLVAIARSASGNRAEPITLHPVPASPGLYAGQVADLDCVGEQVTLTVQLTSAVLDGYRAQSRQANVSLKCLSPIRFAIHILYPTPEKSVPMHGSRLDGWPLPDLPIPIRVQIADEEEHPLPAEDVFPNVNQALRAVVSTNSGEQSEQIVLERDPYVEGLFTGEIADLVAEGEHLLVVELTNTPYLNYQPLADIVSTHFERRDGLFRRPTIYWFAVGSLMVFALLAIYWVLTYKKITGTLCFTRQGVTVELPLKHWKNWIVFRSRELATKGDFYLEKLTIESLGKDKNQVRVRCKSDNGTRLQFDLSAGEKPEDYSKRSVYQICYKV